MSPEEVRRSRLAALDPSGATPPPPSPPAAAAASLPPLAAAGDPPTTVTFLEDDDGDAELQRALAMSLQQHGEEQDEIKPLPYHHYPQQYHSADASATNSSSAYSMMEEDSKPAAVDPPMVVQKETYDISAFHALMWDSQATTENDKMRWVGQAIHVVVEDKNSDNNGNDNNRDSPTTQASMYRNVLEEVAQSHTPWGLQQQHGGPCGVLAAVQAEVLRLLLWGPRTASGDLEYPFSPQQLQPCSQPISALMRPAMARAIALILARASLTPISTTASSAAGTSDAGTPRKPVVRIILPKQGQGGPLQWEDLEPWISGSGTVSNRLEMYTLEEETATAAKRQKRPNASTSDLILKVASQVTNFLLNPRSDSNEHHHYQQSPLDYFSNAGGVLLLVMSMVASRGATVIQDEFDDPLGTKLTAQFGHCSQELINLLLTGQAVSNVFNDTMN